MQLSKILGMALLLICPLLIGDVVCQNKAPRTAREFFMLLPQKLFEIENLDRDKKKFLTRALKVEDNENGYMEARGDGSQESFKMTLFKRSNGTYVIGLFVFGEWGEKYSFLEYRNRRWSNISKSVIPHYKRSIAYELPRYGTTIKVFERKNFDPEYDLGEEGKHLYDLGWNHNAFVIKKTKKTSP